MNFINIWFQRLIRSWTIWFNSIIGTLLAFWPYLADNIAALQPYMSMNVYHWLGGILVAGNLVLRFKTNNALKDK
jgi:hypothetical protein